MKRKILYCLFFLLLLSAGKAQQRLVDSILKELQQPMPDSNRAMSMMRLAVDYEVVDTAHAYRSYREAIEFASGKKLYYQLGRIYQNQSILYTSAANYEAAHVSLDHAIESYQLSDHAKAKQWEANAYNDKANTFKAQNEFKQAIAWYLKSIALIEEYKLPARLIHQYANLSTVFGDIGENDKQTEYALKAVAAAKRDGTRQNLFMAYFILAAAYSRQDSNGPAKTAIDSSTVYFNEAENEDNIDILFSYYLISGQVFKKVEQFDSAFYFLQKAYDISKTYHYSYGQAESQLQMGAIAIMQKRYADAEKYLLSGIKEAEAVHYFGILDNGYKYLSDIYAVTGRYQEAYLYLQKHKETHDSVVSMESKKYGTELEKKYETAKKDALLLVQHAEIGRKNTLNYILIVGTALLLAISLLLYRNYRQKQKLQQQRISELETEKQLTAMEAVLKGEEQERTRLAKDLHDGLGGMMSGIKYSFLTMKRNLIMTPENQQAFERSMDMLDSSINELRRVAHNMMPEALVKFGLDTALKDFCNDINQAGPLQVTYQSIGISGSSFDQTIAITIYRIVQELLNNAMKHAAAKTAIVQVSRTNDIITITVEDDGKGFNPEILQASKGIGWSNIESRIRYLKGKSDVRSEAGKGTSIHIELYA